MKKIILVVIVIFLLASCTPAWQAEHDFDLKNLGYNKLYYHPDFDTLTSFYEISKYIRNNVSYVENSTNTDPEAILMTGEANCNGFCVLFANIAYFSMGIEVSIASVNDSYRTRKIIDGGYTNHSVCYWEGTLIDPLVALNPIVEYSRIGYLYPFNSFLFF